MSVVRWIGKTLKHTPQFGDASKEDESYFNLVDWEKALGCFRNAIVKEPPTILITTSGLSVAISRSVWNLTLLTRCDLSRIMGSG